MLKNAKNAKKMLKMLKMKMLKIAWNYLFYPWNDLKWLPNMIWNRFLTLNVNFYPKYDIVEKPACTCFYRAIVYDVPDCSFGDYMITFEDPSYQSGLSPPIPVCQKYVVRAPVKN